MTDVTGAMDSEDSRMTSASLIAGVQAGKEDAWIRMTNLFGPMVYKWIRTMARERVQSHDIANISQEVFLTAIRKISSYRHSKEKNGSFRAWLYGVTRINLLQYIEKVKKIPFSTYDLLEVLESDVDPEHNVAVEDKVWELEPGRTSLAVENVRAKTEPHNWEIFWRTVIHGEESIAVARELGMSPEAARQARKRTVVRLRDEILRLAAEQSQ